MSVPSVSPDQVKEKIHEGVEVAFVDVRAAAAWDASEMVLPAAVRVAPDQVDHGLAIIPHGRPVVLYAGKGEDEVAAKIADRLAAHGWEDVAVLQGGFDAWKDAGLPIEEKVQAS